MRSNEENNERFARLDILRKATWDSIEARRSMEWKVCIALWSLQAAFAYALIQKPPPLDIGEKFLVALLPLGLVIIHTRWIYGLYQAYKIDKLEEQHLRDAMYAMSDYQRPEKVVEALNKIEKERWPASDEDEIFAFANTMHGAQVATTALLASLGWMLIVKCPDCPWVGSECPKVPCSTTPRSN